MAFWTLIVILTRSKRTPTHSVSPSATYDCVQGRFGASVFEMKTFEPDSKSILGLEPAKQVTEKHMSDLLTVSERNVDVETFYLAEFAGVECQLLVVGPKR